MEVTFSDDIPLAPAKLNGISGEFALDTGNGGSTVIQHLWAENNGLADQMKRGVEMVSFGSGGETKNWASRIHEFEIAGRTFQNTIGRYAEDKQGSFSSRTEAGNIGTELLANFKLDFDYSHDRVWFEYVPGYTPPPFQRSGMSLYRDEPKKLLVANVLPGGPAAKAGLRKDDVVITIAGKQAELIGRREVSRILSQTPGTIIPVTYSRDGKELKAEIALQEVLP